MFKYNPEQKAHVYLSHLCINTPYNPSQMFLFICPYISPSWILGSINAAFEDEHEIARSLATMGYLILSFFLFFFMHQDEISEGFPVSN